MTIKPEAASVSPNSPETAVPCSVPFAEALGEIATGYVAPSVVAMGDVAPATLGRFFHGDKDVHGAGWWLYAIQDV